MTTFLRYIGLIALASTLLVPIGALWWWALHGMSGEVAVAFIFTPPFTLAIAMLCGWACIERDKQEAK